MLDALAVMGTAEVERHELLRGLSAVLHLGEVRKGGRGQIPLRTSNEHPETKKMFETEV